MSISIATHCDFRYNDGGRREAGFKGSTSDCVVRAIAIAAEQDYKGLYDDLFDMQRAFAQGRSRRARRCKGRGASPRIGVWKEVYHAYLESIGWAWQATCQFGSSERTHLLKNELPAGRLICRVSRHLVAVIDGVIHDTYDCSRDGSRMVYGYFKEG